MSDYGCKVDRKIIKYFLFLNRLGVCSGTDEGPVRSEVEQVGLMFHRKPRRALAAVLVVLAAYSARYIRIAVAHRIQTHTDSRSTDSLPSPCLPEFVYFSFLSFLLVFLKLLLKYKTH